MKIKVFDPSNKLQDVVKNYVVINSIDEIHKIIFLPNGGNFIFFNRGLEIKAKLFGEDSVHKIPASYSIGSKTNKVKYIFDFKYKNEATSFPIVLVELLPIGYYKLFGKDLSKDKFGYTEFDKDTIDTYFSQLYTHCTLEDEINYIDDTLSKIVEEQNYCDPVIEDIMSRIDNDYHLGIKVDDILEEFDYSRSTLERHFKKFIGLTPKQFILISKFCKTILAYTDEKRTFKSMPYLYSDNSHMNAVFKKFLGVPPREVFNKILDGESYIYQQFILNNRRERDMDNENIISPNDILEYSKYCTVLYVEDDKILHEQTKMILECYFEKVDSAFDGMEGLDDYKEYLENNKKAYDIVITDISMPYMNGIDMSKEILSINNNQKIAVISAHSDKKHYVDELDIDFIRKPIANEELSRVIMKLSKEACEA